MRYLLFLLCLFPLASHATCSLDAIGQIRKLSAKASNTFYPAIEGVQRRDWVVSGLFDADSSSGKRDYQNGYITYNGHTGIDLVLPNFYKMFEGVDVYASKPGVVSTVRDGYPDRNTSWNMNNNANLVYIHHKDGTCALYGHFKKGSITVSKNQIVTAGQKIGEVGSSGRSTTPHLHFELFNSAGKSIDPMLKGYPLSYPHNPKIIKFGASYPTDENTSGSYWHYPPANRTSIRANTTVRFWAQVHALDAGEEIRSYIIYNGKVTQTRRRSYSVDYRRHTTWFERQYSSRGWYTMRHVLYRYGNPVYGTTVDYRFYVY